MSIAATKWARATNLPSTQRFILLALADFADDDGICWPSIRRIIESTGLSERCIRYSMSGFREVGLIRGGGQRGSSQKIILNLHMSALSDKHLEAIKKAACQKKSSASRAGKSASPAGKSSAPAAPTPAPAAPSSAPAAPHIKTTMNHHEPSEGLFSKGQTETETAGPEIEDQFNRFWAAYPRKDAKGAARKAFEKAIRKIPADRIIAAVQAWPFDAQLKPHGDFRPHAATWLNAERWEDEAVQVAVQAQADREQYPAPQIEAFEAACRRWRAAGFDGAKPRIEQFAMEIA